jgi:hypothetical protein
MKRLVLIAAATAALAAPGVASAHSRGVVVKVEQARHAVAVSRAGRVGLFHARGAEHLRVGQVIRFDERRRDDGAMDATRIRVVGTTTRAKIEGLVTASSATSFTITAGGVQFTFPTFGTPLAVGSAVRVEIRIKVRAQPAQAPVVNPVPAVVVDEIEGRLTIGAGTVTVQNGARSVTLTVPTGFDLSRFRTGDSVEAKFAKDAAGKLTLAKLELRNADEDEDEDADHDGGDDHGGHGDDHGGGDHRGHGRH